MKFTIESYNDKIVIEKDHDDVDIYEMMEIIKSILLATGFHHETIKNGFLAVAEEYEIGDTTNVE